MAVEQLGAQPALERLEPRPTVVCLVFSCVAAALKLPVLATARKKRTSSQSPRMFGTLFLRGDELTIVTIDTM